MAKIVFFTSAGMLTESGLSIFRGEGGIFANVRVITQNGDDFHKRAGSTNMVHRPIAEKSDEGNYWAKMKEKTNYFFIME